MSPFESAAVECLELDCGWRDTGGATHAYAELCLQGHHVTFQTTVLSVSQHENKE